MKNYVSEGKNISVVAPTGGLTSGVAKLIGTLFCVPIIDAAEGEMGSVSVEGVFKLPAASALVLALGAKVGFDVETGNIVASADAASDGDVGIVTKAKVNGELTVEVKLVPGLV